MIYIFHGENLSASRNQILNLFQKQLDSGQNYSKKEVLLGDTTPGDLLRMATSVDIFSSRPFIVFDVSSQGRANVDDYIDVLKKVPADNIVVILSSKELSKANAFIKNSADLKARVVLSAQIPSSNVFKFVDAIFNCDRKTSYTELKKLVISDEDPFYLFSMLLYGLRTVAMAKLNSPGFNKIAPFVKSKAMNQSKHFSEESIKRLYSDFYEIDKGMKLGSVPHDVVIPLAIEKVFAASDGS